MDWWALMSTVLGLVAVVHLAMAIFDYLLNQRHVQPRLPEVWQRQEQLGPAPLASMEDLSLASLDTNEGDNGEKLSCTVRTNH